MHAAVQASILFARVIQDRQTVLTCAASQTLRLWDAPRIVVTSCDHHHISSSRARFFSFVPNFSKNKPLHKLKKKCSKYPYSCGRKVDWNARFGQNSPTPWAILDITKMSKIDDPPIRYYKVRDRQSISEQIQSHFWKQVDNICDWPVTKQRKTHWLSRLIVKSKRNRIFQIYYCMPHVMRNV